MEEAVTPVSAEEVTVIVFEAGLFGFPGVKHWVIGDIPGGGDVFRQLVAAEQPELGFTLVLPNVFFPEYVPEISADDLEAVGADSLDQVIVMAIATVPQQVNETTANLKAPLVFNPYARKGRQLILTDERYTTRQRLFKG